MQVGIAFQSASATLVSDPDATPAKAVDGCAGSGNMWSGDRGTVLTLDAGSSHQMQGIYIWSAYGRMEWFRIETSVDGSY